MTDVLTLASCAERTRSRAGAGQGVVASLMRTVKRVAMMTAGGILVLTGIIIAPLPGPLGLPISLVGLVLILRSSYWAKRQFIRAQYAQPKFVYPFRRLMRKNPEFAPVFWQQALRMERLLMRRNSGFLRRARRSAKQAWAQAFRR